MFKLVFRYAAHINLPNIKEDLRKIGVNCVTAGIIGLFVTNIASLTAIIIRGSFWTIAIGLLSLLIGWYKEEDKS